MKRLIVLFLFILVPLFYPASAVYNPQNVSNNKFGIHIIEQADLDEAARLVNSSGGEWGYVTFVIRDDQRQIGQWYDFFKRLRGKRLIPIVRIATHIENGVWTRPNKEDASGWASFLNSLPWPTKNRYVILFNEPNHAKEWGNNLNPKEYAQTANTYIDSFKASSKDFFMLNAGFDLAAGNIPNQTIDALWFMQEMNNEVKGIFTKFDGWVSHSYPNPNFTSNPYNDGRRSILGYRFEQEFLKNNFGIPNKPVFITETGWLTGPYGLSDDLVAKYYKTAFNDVWKDDNLIAVTPFLLKYPQQLFSDFSWIDKEGNPKKQYQEVLGLSKTSGNPQLAPVSNFGKLLERAYKKPPQLTQIPELLF